MRSLRDVRDRLAERDPDARHRHAHRLDAFDVDAGDETGLLRSDGVGDSLGPDVPEVEQHGQRVGPSRHVRHRLAGFDDE